jgi:DNA polymerase III subunit epsilon
LSAAPFEKQLTMLGLDFETNGYSRYDTFKPVEIGLVYLQAGQPAMILASSYISGAKWISPPAYQTHRITLNDCKGKPGPEAYADILQIATKQPVCVHAKGTERKILIEHYGILEVEWIDTLTLSRRHLPECPNHRLQTVVEYLKLEEELHATIPDGRWHSAAFDAAASILIAKRLLPLEKTKAKNPCQKGEIPQSGPA